MLVDLILKVNRTMEGKEKLRPGVKWGEQYIFIFPLRAVFIELTNIYRGPNVFHVYSNSFKAIPDSEVELKRSD